MSISARARSSFIPGLGMTVELDHIASSRRVEEVSGTSCVVSSEDKAKEVSSSWFSRTSFGKWVSEKKVAYDKANTPAAKARAATDKKVAELRNKYFNVEVRAVNSRGINQERNSLELTASMKSYVDALVVKLDAEFGQGEEQAEAKTQALMKELEKISSDKRFSGQIVKSGLVGYAERPSLLRHQLMISQILSYLTCKNRPDLFNLETMDSAVLGDERLSADLAQGVFEARERVIKNDRTAISHCAQLIVDHLKSKGKAGNLAAFVSHLGVQLSANPASKYAGNANAAIRDMNDEVRRVLNSDAETSIADLFDALEDVAEGKKSREGLVLDERLQDLDLQLNRLIETRNRLKAEIEGFRKNQLGFTTTNATLIDVAEYSRFGEHIGQAAILQRQRYDFLAVGYQRCITDMEKLIQQRSELVAAIEAQPAKEKAFLDAKIVDYAQLYTPELLSRIQVEVKAARAARSTSSTMVVAESSRITAPTRYWFDPLRWIGY